MAVAETDVIAVVVPAIAREGISKLVLSQIKYLQDKQYHVVLIVLSNVSEEMFHELKVYLPPCQLLVLNQKDAYLSVTNLFTSCLLLYPIMKFLKEHKAQVVIAHAPYAHFVMRLTKFRFQFGDLKVKLIQYFHITQYAQFPLNTTRRIFINKLYEMLGKNYDEAHIYVSKAVKKDIEQNLFNHESSHIIYNAVPSLNDLAGASDTSNSCATVAYIRPSAFLIVIPGRIEEGKGQLFFVQVLNLFLKQKDLSPDDIQVLIIGDGVQRTELTSAVESYCLGEYISLPGVVPNAELLHWMKQANLVVLPSFFEGLPLVALEAMQSRVLLLTSDIASFQEVIEPGQNGFLFKAGDVTDCLEKLQFIYTNRAATLINLDEVAQQAEHKFSFERHMAQLIQAINLVKMG